ncbi:MAG: ATP-binding protein [Patescibacteria group bacterium]|nr:ATP-binding protein [Patescibacteria group bacterium]
MEELIIALMSILIASLVMGLGYLIYKFIKIRKNIKHRKKQAENLRFIQVRIPKNAVARNSDIDAKDHANSMKDNIALMNQVYKNFYAIYEKDLEDGKLGNNYISMEILSEKEVIKVIMAVPKDHIFTIQKMISSFYSGAVVQLIEEPKLLDFGKYYAGGEFKLTKDSVHPIKTYEAFEADPMDSILSAFSSVSREEKLCLQIIVEPLSEDWLKKMRKKCEEVKNDDGLKGFAKFWNRLTKDQKKQEEEKEKTIKHNFSQQQLGDFEKKMDDELFHVKIRALAVSPEKNNPNKIISDLTRLFNQYNYMGLNSFKFEKTDNLPKFTKDFVMRSLIPNCSILKQMFSKEETNILNIKELSSMIHFPHGRFNLNPRLAWQKYKIVSAPDNLPNEGLTVGFNEFAGVKRAIRITDKDRFRHVYILGQTGTGKSTIMLYQAIDDMNNGRGFTFIDPHGDACEFLLKHYPKERIDDLIYFDLGNTQYPIGLNPLEVDPENSDEQDVVTNDLVEMFIQMYGPEIFGPRIQDYFRNACFLLMDQPE